MSDKFTIKDVNAILELRGIPAKHNEFFHAIFYSITERKEQSIREVMDDLAFIYQVEHGHRPWKDDDGSANENPTPDSIRDEFHPAHFLTEGFYPETRLIESIPLPDEG